MSSMPLKNLLRRVKSLLKEGKFEGSLLDNVTALKALVDKNKVELRANDQLNYFKAKCMIYEVRDYFNLIDADESREVKVEGMFVEQSLPEKVGSNISTQERQLIREKVRFCLAYANELYREDYYEVAREKISGLYNFVLEELSDESLPCFGTIAQLTYFLGKVHRQMAEYEKAEKWFAASIEYHYRRAEKRNTPAEYAFSNYKAAVCLGLGIGWVNFTRGFLTRALYNITPALLTLGNTSDTLNRAYLNLIYGSIKRSQAGVDKRKLQEAIRIISQSFHVFEEKGHRRYLARAAFELALAFNLTGAAKEAESKLEIVERIAEERDDFRWQSHALVVRSRVQRNTHRYAEALESAEKAFNKAERHQQRICKIDALIAKGEAKLALEEYAPAREDFEEALSLNDSVDQHSHLISESVNPKVYAVCHLYLARSYALEGNEQNARESFQKWDKAGKIEHLWVHHLAGSVKREIDELGGSFFIRATDSLNYRDRVRELRGWLLEQAESKEPNNLTKRAKLLGLTRSRLSQLVHERSQGSQGEK